MAKTSLKAYVESGAVTVDNQALGEALLAAASEVSSGGAGAGGVEYVAFSGKTGSITFGRDREELDEDEQFIIEPLSCFLGWVCWKDSKPIARHQWLAHEAHNRVAASELADHGPYRKAQEGWQESVGFGFMSADGDVMFEFSTNSKSGRNAVGAMMTEIGTRTVAGEPNYALFRFTKEKFQAQGEWNWKPKFLVDEWLDKAEVAEMMGEEAEVEEAEVEEAQEEEAKPARAKRTRRT